MRDRNQQSKPEIEAENPRDRAKPMEHEEQRQTTHKTKKGYIKNDHHGPIKSHPIHKIPTHKTHKHITFVLRLSFDN